MRSSALQYLYLQKPVSTVVMICAIGLLPWLGSDFYTKGEPREAAVAASMLESGDWILPKVYADEIAYKPPMMHWLIALVSLPQGEVTEFSSRLPSAIAQIVLIGFVLFFFGRRIRFQEAFIATLLLLTCFEIHRAGLTARVDMLLTTFIVLGMMQLYRWENKLELKGLPIIIPLLLSGAVLTKGPVGIVLPLFVFGVHLLLLRKYNLAKIAKSLSYIAVASLFLPLLWYIAAYRQGGDTFLHLTLAENFGRFFHINNIPINYELGHREGPFYYPLTLLAGFLPWTLLFVFSLFGIRWRFQKKSFQRILANVWNGFNSMEKMKRFSLVAVVCIFVFYVIPSSKRSVYIMPLYPFLSILLAQYLIYITEHRAKVTRIFAYALASIVGIVFAASLCSMAGLVDLGQVAAGFASKGSLQHTVASIAGALSPSIASYVIMPLLALALGTVLYQTTKHINIKILYATILLVYCLNLYIDGIIMRGVKKAGSARSFTEQILSEHQIDERDIYVMNDLSEYKNHYALNFYLGNRFHNFKKEHPREGLLLLAEKELQPFLEKYGAEYLFRQLNKSQRLGDIRDNAVLLQFERQ